MSYYRKVHRLHPKVYAHKRDPEAKGDRKVPKWFADTHHFTKMRKGDKETFVCFLINMYAPTKSGYLVEQQDRHLTFEKPLLCSSCEKAMKFERMPCNCPDTALRIGRHVPKYYYPVILSFDECKNWTNGGAWKDKHIPEADGEIKYF